MRRYFVPGGVFLLVAFAMLLRFYQIEHMVAYGWDQSRDAFLTRDLIHGNLLLQGPKTGVGNFYLGPLYFYLLAPFFLLTNLDPIASQYLNMIVTGVTFVVLFVITRKLFSISLAFLVLGLYITSFYLIRQNQIPWNVSFVPLLSFLIFYYTEKVFREKRYRPTAILAALCGAFFHAHFTMIIFPVMIGIMTLITDQKKKMLLLFIKALPFYLVWFIPTIIDYMQSGYAQNVRIQDFWQFYFVGVHAQFILYRLPDILIQFKTLFFLPPFVTYLLVVCLAVYYFKTRSVTDKLLIRIMAAWMFATMLIFGTYGGPISDYYFLPTIPVVFYTFLLLVRALFLLKQRALVWVVVLLAGSYYLALNAWEYQFIPRDAGLFEQKQAVQQAMKEGKTFPYNEGDIKAYLYELYKERGL